MLVWITGASAGFGAAMARQFIAHGHRVLGIARRTERLQALQQELGDAFHPLAVDVGDAEALQRALASLPEAWREPDVLVNNAGLARGMTPAQESSLADWEEMVQTNIIGLLRLTRAVLPGMVARNRGHIINLGSTAGNWPYFGGNVYGATKAFVKQFSQNLRADLAGSKVRVSNIEPGLCGGTEFSQVRFHGDSGKAAQVYANVEALSADDIAETILWIAERPPHVNINRIEIMPVAQSFAGLSIAREP
ncbi:MAG: SDR family oxidoreductase [Cardiobacteriaceae bacterium]|nr:SDR family oxidoreductase [Cardiobacteriaceae bacterium]